jgi:hypothetical protein
MQDPQSYKIVEGHTLNDSIGKDENGDQWNVILAFFAFKTKVPGSNKYAQPPRMPASAF